MTGPLFHVKICGVTTPQAARLVAAAGADAVGLNFVAGSPRRLEVAAARGVAAAVPPGILKVGVFAGSSPAEIRSVVSAVGHDAVQLHGHLFAAGVHAVVVSAGQTNAGKTHSLFGPDLNGVRLTATDAAGNAATCSFSVTVADNEVPTVVCPANISATAAPGLCSANVTFIATATDNCTANPSIVYSIPSGSAFNVGTTAVTATATDLAGNVATCSFSVTVADNEVPTVVCPANISVTAAPGLCTALPNLWYRRATRICPPTHPFWQPCQALANTPAMPCSHRPMPCPCPLLRQTASGCWHASWGSKMTHPAVR
jgi:hypothetical protein